MPKSHSGEKRSHSRSKSHSGEKKHNLSILADVFGLSKPIGNAAERSTIALRNVTSKYRFTKQKHGLKYGGKRRRTRRRRH
jgi:hypothetical protein